MPGFFQSIRNHPLISRVRRNHGLEHATLHTLARRFPRQPMGGYTYPGGFWLVANLPTEAVREAVEEALGRMQAGERSLAVHPFCGTNFVTTGTLAGLAGAAAMLGAGPRKRDKLDRLPLAAALATLALIVAQPLAMTIQAHVTTSGEPGALQVKRITRLQPGGRFTIHHIETQG